MIGRIGEHEGIIEGRAWPEVIEPWTPESLPPPPAASQIDEGGYLFWYLAGIVGGNSTMVLAGKPSPLVGTLLGTGWAFVARNLVVKTPRYVPDFIPEGLTISAAGAAYYAINGLAGALAAAKAVSG